MREMENLKLSDKISGKYCEIIESLQTKFGLYFHSTLKFNIESSTKQFGTSTIFKK